MIHISEQSDVTLSWICLQAVEKAAYLRRRVERIGTQEAWNLASHDLFSGKTSVDRSSILVNVMLFWETRKARKV